LIELIDSGNDSQTIAKRLGRTESVCQKSMITLKPTVQIQTQYSTTAK
jgi:hypothetical protein